MRLTHLYHGLLWCTALGAISIIFINISLKLQIPKQKLQLLKETISTLKKEVKAVFPLGYFEMEGKGRENFEKAEFNTGSVVLGSNLTTIIPEVVFEARDNVSTFDARGEMDESNARGKGGESNARGEEGQSNARGKEGQPNARGEEGESNARGESETNVQGNQPNRLSLIAIGNDRTGTTFINRMFNEDPNIFNVYEPLWMTKDISHPEKQRDAILDTLNGILNCNFSATTNGVKFLAGISKWIAVRLNSKAMMSYPFCNIKSGVRVCEDMSKIPRYTDKICATKYKYSVTKLGVPRIPGENISSITRRALNENPNTRVLYMVRDPRGSINSRINAGWMKEYTDPNMESSVKSLCDTIMHNLRYMQILMKNHEYEERCMIVRYKDIADNPLTMAKKIYRFARFQIEPRLTEWIMNHTKPSKEKLKLEITNTFSVVRNSTGNADKWRKESPVERVRLINRVCASLLHVLGIE